MKIYWELTVEEVTRKIDTNGEVTYSIPVHCTEDKKAFFTDVENCNKVINGVYVTHCKLVNNSKEAMVLMKNVKLLKILENKKSKFDFNSREPQEVIKFVKQGARGKGRKSITAVSLVGKLVK